MSNMPSLWTCGKCRWVSKQFLCPKCQAPPSRSARDAYGDSAYRYAKTQRPWFDHAMAELATRLKREIELSQPRAK